MPNVVEFKITGMAEIEDALERAPLRVSRRVLRTGLLAAAFVWAREMEARARQGWHHGKGKHTEHQFGVLARSIVTRASVKSDLEGSVRVGPAKGTFWSVFLEFGTSKMRAFPFIRTAFETRKQDVLSEFEIETKAALEREGIRLS